MTNNKLNNCLHCGSGNIVERSECHSIGSVLEPNLPPIRTYIYKYQCENCGIQTDFYTDKNEAIKRWNSTPIK